MSGKEISCGSYRLTRRDSSGEACISVETKRRLTSGEIAMAKKVFNDAINYNDVYIHDEEYLPIGLQNNNTVMTPNGEIYFPEGHYKTDYSGESNSYKHLFIHEMVHVWQYQLGYPVERKGLLLHTGCKIKGCNPYTYSLFLDKKLCDFNMEQQGDIIADYFVYYCLNLPVEKTRGIVSGSGYSFRNYKNEYLVTLSDFLKDPSNTNNLPNS